MKKYLAIAFLIPILLFNSCKNDRLDVDVSDIDLDLNVKRLDKSFFPIDTKNPNKPAELESEFGSFMNIYLKDILRAPGIRTDTTLNFLANDPVYPLVLEVQNSINSMESNIATQVKALENGFKHLKYYFPNAEIPEVVLYNSWFQYGILSTENYLAIGLDFFVEDKAIQNQYPPQFYNYLKADMTPKYIAINAMYGHLYNSVFPYSGEEKTLLDNIVYKGKLRYLLEAMYPKAAEADIMNYTQEELEWCYSKQLAVWRELTKVNPDENVANIYITKKNEINKWLSPGPFTSALSENATDRMGEWIGLQMIRDYMKENPDVSVTEMLKVKPIKFLKFYNPKR